VYDLEDEIRISKDDDFNLGYNWNR